LKMYMSMLQTYATCLCCLPMLHETALEVKEVSDVGVSAKLILALCGMLRKIKLRDDANISSTFRFLVNYLAQTALKTIEFEYSTNMTFWWCLAVPKEKV
jgi:hypothetical protein